MTLIITFIVALAVVVADQLTKLWAVSYLKPIQHMSVIEQIFNFDYVENKGAAFGMGQNMRWFFVVLSLIFVVAFVVFLVKKKINNKLFVVSSALIIGGTVGNLIDRFFNGYVVDFLKFTFFPPSCNIADYSLTIGAVLLVVYICLYTNKEKNPI